MANNKIIQIMPLPNGSSHHSRLAYIPKGETRIDDEYCEVVGLALMDNNQLWPIVKLHQGSHTMDFELINPLERSLHYFVTGREFDGDRLGDPAWEFIDGDRETTEWREYWENK